MAIRTIRRSLVLLSVYQTLIGPSAARAQSPADRRLSTQQAAVLGTLLPGAGHMYAGEPLRGLAFFGLSASSIGFGLYAYSHTACPLPQSGLFVCDQRQQTRAMHWYATTLLAMGAATWVLSAVDAPRAVRRQLARRPLRVGTAEGRPIDWTLVTSPPSGSSPRVLLGVSGAW